MHGPPGLVSTKEAARQLDVHPKTLQRWARRGVVVPDWTSPGGHYRWDVDRLLREARPDRW